jgi:hypothetical protein
MGALNCTAVAEDWMAQASSGSYDAFLEGLRRYLGPDEPTLLQVNTETLIQWRSYALEIRGFLEQWLVLLRASDREIDYVISHYLDEDQVQAINRLYVVRQHIRAMESQLAEAEYIVQRLDSALAAARNQVLQGGMPSARPSLPAPRRHFWRKMRPDA